MQICACMTSRYLQEIRVTVYRSRKHCRQATAHTRLLKQKMAEVRPAYELGTVDEG